MQWKAACARSPRVVRATARPAIRPNSAATKPGAGGGAAGGGGDAAATAARACTAAEAQASMLRLAQAVAAGLLSVAFGEEAIDVGHVNDPDRNYPLDITVFDDRAEEKNVRFSVERM